MRWLLPALGLSLVSFVAPVAQAYPVAVGWTAWPFEGRGTGSLSGGYEYAVSGVIGFDPIATSFHASVDGVPDPIFALSYVSLLVEDGSGGSPDRLISAFVPTNRNSLMELRLIDNEGTAFDGLPGLNMPPAYAPDASRFEVRQINLWEWACYDFGPVPCSAGGGEWYPGIVFTITIDAFDDPLPVPEPSGPVSIALAIAALLASRRFNRSCASS